jgi:predicted phosphodiesterase
LSKWNFKELDMDALMAEYKSVRAIEKALGIGKDSLGHWLRNQSRRGQDFVEVKAQAEKLALQKQKLQDINRVERKSWRESARLSNALEELDRTLINILKNTKNDFNNPCVKQSDSARDYGIIQLSDLHLNECVDESFNEYNWDIASKRLTKHFKTAMKHFKDNGVKKVLVAMTGDMLNSDRRLDEITTNQCNRASALFLATSLIASAVRDLCLNEFDVSVTFVVGNESRIDQDLYNTKMLASNNFDYMIFNMLRCMLESTGVVFHYPQSVLESVVTLGDYDILLIHGNNGISKDIDTSVSKFKAKYMAMGIKIDYVMFGHIHQTLISDSFGRSGSLTGDNSYNYYGLNISGKPTQNYYIVSKDNGICGYKVDLFNTNNVIGYSYDRNLETYNSKANDKLFKGDTVLRIKI